MINKADLLDPSAIDHLSEYERSVVDGAQNAGHGPRHLNLEKTGEQNFAGSLQQVIIPAAIRAAEYGPPGGNSDISDGISDLREALAATLGNSSLLAKYGPAASRMDRM